MKDMIATIAYLWNRGVCYMRLLAQGDDWEIFFKFAASLYFLKLISSQALTVVIGVSLVLAFMLYFIYEQYESEVAKLNLPASVQLFLENHGILMRHM
ncbi:3beta-hydroxysteroid-dehydrogenase/decarboxylase-like isoform X5 [Prunus avium]|uniref:3beta-hydroxysteroid- dehydrogenase/decarboxylase-like isoform X5 n=1 Tax=Prunus avium TaxID=42229 RepID=A0A6P5TZV4_PRUAV|nr:3beta-hydroxysteroid-dehydrogenase/decarboxylase-like isoform X5 [Prunus avium]